MKFGPVGVAKVLRIDNDFVTQALQSYFDFGGVGRQKHRAV
jgi:hypothetical protein